MRRDEVYAKLDLVEDPELDESLTKLGFIHEVAIENDDVSVVFRLPTYWCSPNFAFLMASDIRDRVRELTWVKSVRVRLDDHCASEEISRGVTDEQNFADAFPDIRAGELDELRQKFRVKSFMSRQERLFKLLRANGWSDSEILQMTVADIVREIANDEEQLRQRYLNIRAELGFSSDTSTAAFHTSSGAAISLDELPTYLLQLRRTRISQEFNTAYCRGLFNTRYQEAAAATNEMEVVQ